MSESLEYLNDCSSSMIAMLLNDAFNLVNTPLVDRSHRSLQPAPKPGEPPRAIIDHLHYYKPATTSCILQETNRRSMWMIWPSLSIWTSQYRWPRHIQNSMMSDGVSREFGGSVWHSLPSSFLHNIQWWWKVLHWPWSRPGLCYSANYTTAGLFLNINSKFKFCQSLMEL